MYGGFRSRSPVEDAACPGLPSSSPEAKNALDYAEFEGMKVTSAEFPGARGPVMATASPMLLGKAYILGVSRLDVMELRGRSDVTCTW